LFCLGERTKQFFRQQWLYQKKEEEYEKEGIDGRKAISTA
jgi:hypothetical protein